jgi:hypothetical protein
VVPTAKFAGPDISNKLAYLTAFAAEAPKHPDVILLTSHYYAMGPAGSPDATMDQMLDPDPKLTTLKRRDLHVIAQAQATAHLPYRMSEGNSCWDGGKPGVSDTFAAALWCADYMLTCAARGWSGVNLHGGGNGFYTPIAGAPSTGLTRRPEYFGMQFAALFAGCEIVPTIFTGAGPRVGAYIFQRCGRRELAVVNKEPQTLRIDLPVGMTATPTLHLTAPSLDAKEEVRLAGARGTRSKQAMVAPYSATVFRCR